MNQQTPNRANPIDGLWGQTLVRDQYDDGGISGGTLERLGLMRLLEGIEDGLIDVIVVYKIDRLSRSLDDFAELVEVFDRNGVTFVSVTQSFNTTLLMAWMPRPGGIAMFQCDAYEAITEGESIHVRSYYHRHRL